MDGSKGLFTILHNVYTQLASSPQTSHMSKYVQQALKIAAKHLVGLTGLVIVRRLLLDKAVELSAQCGVKYFT